MDTTTNSILERILLEGIYLRDVGVRPDGSVYMYETNRKTKKPILRNVNDKIVIQEQSRVKTSWMYYNISDQNITWAFNKEDFYTEEEVQKIVNETGRERFND